MPSAITKLVAGLVVLAASRADASPGASGFLIGSQEGSFVLVGGNAGLIVGHGDTSWLAGAEVSLVRMTDTEAMLWFGGYADIVDDANHAGARISLGGELGAGFLGIDAGVVVDLGGDRVSLRFRPALTAGIVTAYIGPVIPVAGSADQDSWTEVGLLVKLPIRL